MKEGEKNMFLHLPREYCALHIHVILKSLARRRGGVLSGGVGSKESCSEARASVSRLLSAHQRE